VSHTNWLCLNGREGNHDVAHDCDNGCQNGEDPKYPFPVEILCEDPALEDVNIAFDIAVVYSLTNTLPKTAPRGAPAPDKCQLNTYSLYSPGLP
jgi:hypothetical protein